MQELEKLQVLEYKRYPAERSFSQTKLDWNYTDHNLCATSPLVAGPFVL